MNVGVGHPVHDRVRPPDDDDAVLTAVLHRRAQVDAQGTAVGRDARDLTLVGRGVRVVVAVDGIRDIARRLRHGHCGLTRGRDRRLTAEAVAVDVTVPGGAGRALVGRAEEPVVAIRGVRHIARRLRDGNLRHARGRDRRLTPEGVSVRVAVPGRARGATLVGLPVAVVVEVVATDLGHRRTRDRAARDVVVRALPHAGALADTDPVGALLSDAGVGALDHAALVDAAIAVVVQAVGADLGHRRTGDRAANRPLRIRGAEPLPDLKTDTRAC